jgi:hypothetical protein
MEDKVEYQPEQQKLPKGFATKSDYKFFLTPEEFHKLDEVLQIFAMPLAIVNNLRNKAFAEKGIVPVFEEDLDENGKIKDIEAFWQKHVPAKVAE